jgi:hypothetical protein
LGHEFYEICISKQGPGQLQNSRQSPLLGLAPKICDNPRLSLKIPWGTLPASLFGDFDE